VEQPQTSAWEFLHTLRYEKLKESLWTSQGDCPRKRVSVSAVMTNDNRSHFEKEFTRDNQAMKKNTPKGAPM
jgi:hypothetical protein